MIVINLLLLPVRASRGDDGRDVRVQRMTSPERRELLDFMRYALVLE